MNLRTAGNVIDHAVVVAALPAHGRSSSVDTVGTSQSTQIAARR